MDPAEAQDLIDARPLEYPESGSDGEEERMSEPLGGEDSGFDGSPGETSGSGALKRAATTWSLSRQNVFGVMVRARQRLLATNSGMAIASSPQAAEGLTGRRRLLRRPSHHARLPYHRPKPSRRGLIRERECYISSFVLERQLFDDAPACSCNVGFGLGSSRWLARWNGLSILRWRFCSPVVGRGAHPWGRPRRRW